MNRLSRLAKRRKTKSPNRARRLLRSGLECLESRQLLAGDVTLFMDSFEVGANSNDWVGNWVEDSQNDWFRSTQRATEGVRSAEVDGLAQGATLTTKSAVDLTGYASAELTFDWLIESGFDRNEFLSLNISSDNGATWQTDVLRLAGNVDAENVWHSETVDLAAYALDAAGDPAQLKIQFLTWVSGSSEDANVDNVKIVGTPVPSGPPEISISDAEANEAGSARGFVDAISLDGDGINGWSWGVAKGSNGDLYVSYGQVIADAVVDSRIEKIDGVTGEVTHDFIPLGTSGLSNAKELEVHGGWIYVANKATNEVLRFDEATGAPDPAGPFVSSGSGGLVDPRGMVFDVAGDLLVSSKDSDSILKFSGTDGSFLSVFASSVTAGGTGPKDVALDASGSVLYVAGNDRIYQYNAVNGTLLGAITSPSLTDPAGVELGPDGALYTTNVSTAQVLQFDVQSGALLSVIDVDPLYGEPIGLAFDDSGTLHLATHLTTGEVLRYAPSSSAVFIVGLLLPSTSPISVDFTASSGTATSSSDFDAASGTLVFEPGVTSRTIIVPTIDDSAVESDETFTVTLSNAVGSTIADATGLGTIFDDDAAKSVFISDAEATEGAGLSSQFADAFVSASSGGLNGPGDVIFGADGNMYASSKFGDAILRYDGATGQFMDTFVAPGSGGLDNPQGLLFGPDGNLYVTSRISDEVLRYDATSGAFIDAFVTAGSGGLDNPTEFTFGPDNNLYVSSGNTNQVLRYDGTTGAFIDEFVVAGAGGIDFPHGLLFGSDGNLIVISQRTNSVLRYNGSTGAFMDTFVASGSGGLDSPVHMAFGPAGDLFLGSSLNHSVLRYDGTSGAFVEAYVGSGSGGLASPTGLAFDSDGNLFVSSPDTNEVLRYAPSSSAVFIAGFLLPSTNPISVDFTTGSGTATAGSDFAAVSGTLQFAPGVTALSLPTFLMRFAKSFFVISH